MKKLLFILYITTSFISQTSVASINSLGRGKGLENSIKAEIEDATSKSGLERAVLSQIGKSGQEIWKTEHRSSYDWFKKKQDWINPFSTNFLEKSR